MSNSNEHCLRLGRRAFLQNGALLLAAAATVDAASIFANENDEPLRIGLITDLHHADKPPAGTRHYRETLGKLTEASALFEKDKPTFIVELGDLIDAADSVETEQRYLKTVNREFLAISMDRHYVLGNHCVDTLTKAEFLDGVEQTQSYYSFDRGKFHFVVLDSCFRNDGNPYGWKNSKWNDANIPTAELDLKQANAAGLSGRRGGAQHGRDRSAVVVSNRVVFASWGCDGDGGRVAVRGDASGRTRDSCAARTRAAASPINSVDAQWTPIRGTGPAAAATNR